MAQWPCGHTAGFKCAECYRALESKLADTAAFLDRMAACPDAEWWAADCRAQARKLRGET